MLENSDLSNVPDYLDVLLKRAGDFLDRIGEYRLLGALRPEEILVAESDLDWLEVNEKDFCEMMEDLRGYRNLPEVREKFEWLIESKNHLVYLVAKEDISIFTIAEVENENKRYKERFNAKPEESTQQSR